MHKLKQSTNPEHTQHNKFLTRHHSATTLPFFTTCCSTADTHDIHKEKTRIERSHTHKMSMKNLLKKSAIYGDKTPWSINQSQSYVTMKQTDNHSMQYIHSRKPSEISEVNRSVKDEKIQRKTTGKISFNYRKEKTEPSGSINNYHTTNYIVEKYIVQPQEMNIIVGNGHNQHQLANNQPANNNNYNSNGRYFDLSQEFEEYEGHKQSPKWTSQPFSFANESKSNKSPRNSNQGGANNCHFSFGQHQRTTFMSKYMNMGMKEVESKRQSQNSKQSKPRPSLQVQKFKPEQLNHYTEQEYPLLKNSFKKTNFSPFEQQDCNIIDSEQCESQSSSQNSEVIDSYQSIMKRMSSSPPDTHQQVD